MVGPFAITPFLNDHSAFDAYSLLIEADGRRVFYSGDIRGHGRKRALFEALLNNPPSEVDVMLMEGTHVRTDPVFDDEAFESETDLEMQFVDLLKSTPGSVAVLGSAQNGWGWAAVVWPHALVCFLINDQIKLLTYWVLDRCDAQADLPQDSSPLPTAVATSRT